MSSTPGKPTSQLVTAQVIYNLADTAINIAKVASVGGGAFASKRVTQEEEAKPEDKGRVVTYKKLDIDVPAFGCSTGVVGEVG